MRLVFGSLIVLFLCFYGSAFGTHIRAGEIRIERMGCDSRTVKIYLIAYVDLSSAISFGGGQLFLGDGNSLFVPELTPEPLPGFPDIGRVEYITDYTYLTNGSFRVGYLEPNRNDGIINISNSSNVPFYIETVSDIYLNNWCNSTPTLTVPPIDRVCISQLYAHIPGAVDIDGDSLVYSFITPKQGPDQEVPGYMELIEFSSASESGGPARVVIDSANGLMQWDAPGMAGEFVIAIVIDEYRRVGDSVRQVGRTVRDLQILIEDCDNQRPVVTPQLDTCLVAGSLFEKSLLVSDPDGDEYTLEIFGELSNSISIVAPSTEVPGGPNEYQIRWNPSCDDVRQLPYQIIFKATDKGNLTRLSSFIVWNIRVNAPPPELNPVVLDPGGILLTWEDYTSVCEEVAYLEIYRKTGVSAVESNQCIVGVSSNSGYRKIGETSPSSIEFLDSDLIPAATLCYKLVAVFQNGQRSLASDEQCFDFIPADKPVITHVSISKTGIIDGEVIVSWREPFIDNQLDRPWRYILQRENTPDTFINVDTLVVNSTSPDSLGLMDRAVDTQRQPQTYRIQMDSPSGVFNPIYSKTAETVWLELLPSDTLIALSWMADVPWTNIISGIKHDVFIDSPGVNQRIVRVDPVTDGFNYSDTGLTNGIEIDRLYCYRVLTRGNYGNDVIPGPFLNYSQTACTAVEDENPPIPVVITTETRDCKVAYSNELGPRENQISWQTSDSDIAYFEVFYKATLQDEYRLLSVTSNTEFSHFFESSGEINVSLKGCYRIRGIDYFGNVGSFSEEYCIDNCTNFEMPNVFTPNGDDCNDAFKAIHQETINPGCNPTIDPSRQTRFVVNMDIKIFNRWGQEVYRENNTSPETFQWTGTNLENSPVPPGVYFYQAEVEFDALNPESSESYSGWVHLLR